jgi:hypothetical protein
VFLCALALCLVGFVFAVYDYARHGTVLSSSRVCACRPDLRGTVGFRADDWRLATSLGAGRPAVVGAGRWHRTTGARAS